MFGKHFYHLHEHFRRRHDEAPFWAAPPGHNPFDRSFWHGFFGGDPADEDGGGRRRQRRGDIKYALLELLAERPAHGYDLIKQLEERYGGFYRPSAGSVYPTLQMLEEEGHLTSEEMTGKRVYTITESGRALLLERQQRSEGEGREGRHHRFHDHFGGGGPELNDLRQSGKALLVSVMQVAHHGTPAQIKSVRKLLDAARRDIYAILAEDEPRNDPDADQ